jgi:transposase
MLYKNAIVKRARVWAVPERRLKIIELHKEGYNNKQISEIMGIKTDIVSTGIYLARRDKLLPPPEKAPPSRSAVHLLKKLGRKYADLGRMLQVFDALTKEEGALVSVHFAARYADVSLLSFFCQRCVCRGAY